ncbi:hypothetical protein LPH50_06095 [Xylella taiwanensis]|uniref:Uncharacterized protein n=1 Tax=Xylella taiwanensis TaxID=1444770 RepID=Z9JIN0_9GAMM|nr:hypothetical protein [Xylella taiwanensis]EWS77686.1 hypothetical protein AF72_09670 [Xylella taiwanensis]MCD8455538.1 hypothetical protein [Xylella taiwanensis]MCD8457946.1 hypothetical protein [Xylella taiwanensis]MCD8460080.1 hypothetical protein [Xylella taiwanensis]MCD8463861.1 hypothetical protein [Xylella taiwanensis]
MMLRPDLAALASLSLSAGKPPAMRTIENAAHPFHAVAMQVQDQQMKETL